MSDLPRVHTGEPLVRLSDDEIAYRADRGKWTLTEALFHLTGHKPPGYESTQHLQDHFWPAYHQAVDAIQMGKICRRTEQAGERVFIDSPTNWLAWADSIGPEYIKVDERVRRELSQLNTESRSRGGSRPKYNAGLQQFINQLTVEFKDAGNLLTPPTLKAWLVKNANPGEGYDPTPEIPDCDDIEFNGSQLLWKDHTGSQKSIVIKSVDPYISRAKLPT